MRQRERVCVQGVAACKSVSSSTHHSITQTTTYLQQEKPSLKRLQQLCRCNSSRGGQSFGQRCQDVCQQAAPAAPHMIKQQLGHLSRDATAANNPASSQYTITVTHAAGIAGAATLMTHKSHVLTLLVQASPLMYSNVQCPMELMPTRQLCMELRTCNKVLAGWYWLPNSCVRHSVAWAVTLHMLRAWACICRDPSCL